MDFYLGIDLGTSYFKAGIFNEQGKVIGLGRCYVNKESDERKSTCELPITVFWETLHSCVNEAIQNACVRPDEIKSISYSSQANSFVLLDKYDQPLTPLILWPDQRTKKISSNLQALIDKPDFQTITGLGILPGIQSVAAKIDWYQKEDPYLWSKVKNIMSISDYFTFVLTGEKISDYSTSSMTGLFNVPKREWWDEAVRLFNIEKGYLSSPDNTGKLVGSITDKGAQLLGLSTQTLFFLGSLDHHIVALGAGLEHFNYISESTGTVLACVNYQKGYRPREGVNIAPGLKDDYFFQMAFDENGAIALEWYQKKHVLEFSIVELLKIAEDIDPGSEGLIAKPNANRFEGLSGFSCIEDFHLPPHFVRAILESTSLSLLKLVKSLDKSVSAIAIIPSGGGAQSNLWIQIKADILNKTFIIPHCNELACQGAAMLGAIGTSHFNNATEIIENWTQYSQMISPNPTNVEKYKNWCNNIKNKN
ncbi:MAG TPA: hypothetical protein DEH15_19960 [Marinilabiliales bacterium]|nr:hypothetical protein [Marinilabiliales bacterium]